MCSTMFLCYSHTYHRDAAICLFAMSYIRGSTLNSDDIVTVEASETGRVASVKLPTLTVLSKGSVEGTRMLAAEIQLRAPDGKSRSNAIAMAHIVKNSLGRH